jgi:ferrous iron transport protein B
MMGVSGFLGGDGFLHYLLIGELDDGRIDFERSFGLLTTGLFVPFGIILPYVFSFYLLLSLLEDSGYLPRLAVLSDTILHRLGLHGVAVIPMMLGLGCNVPGILSTRIMETRRERFIATALMAIAVPCMAQTSMIIGLIGREGLWGISILFGTLCVVWVTLGLLQNRVLGGESMEIFLEIPPYRVPHLHSLAKKVWVRFIWFVKEAVPWLLGGVLLANLLYSVSVITFLAKMASPLIERIWGLPGEAVGALLIGFLRKDVAVGMLLPLGLSSHQLIVACVVLTMYFPCVATFATLIKELGILATGKMLFVMVLSTMLVGGILNFILHLP